MNKSFWTRKNIMLILIVIWNILLVLFYWKPYLINILEFMNSDAVKYKILNNRDIQKGLYCPMILISIIFVCVLMELIYTILSYINNKWIRFISIGIYIQTIYSFLLKIWNNNFSDSYEIKTWIISSTLVCITIVIFALKQVKQNTIFIFMTTLQLIYTLLSFKTYTFSFFRNEPITKPYYFYAIFECLHGIVIYILYWILIYTKSEKG